MSMFSIEEIKSRCGEYNFDKFEDGIIIFHFEFHWRMTSPVYGLGITFDDLASQVVAGTLQGQNLSVFTPSANLLLAVMHHGGKNLFLN